MLGLTSLRSNSGLTTPSHPALAAYTSGVWPYRVSAALRSVSSHSDSSFTIQPTNSRSLQPARVALCQIPVWSLQHRNLHPLVPIP